MIQKGVIVKAVVFDKQDRILLIRRSKTAPRRALEWDIPGGFVDDDDGSYVEACLRELHEEAGLQAIRGSVQLGFAESDLTEPSSNKRYDMTWLYFTMQTSETDSRLSYEHDKFTWAPSEHAMELIKYDRQLRALKYIHYARNSVIHRIKVLGVLGIGAIFSAGE